MFLFFLHFLLIGIMIEAQVHYQLRPFRHCLSVQTDGKKVHFFHQQMHFLKSKWLHKGKPPVLLSFFSPFVTPLASAHNFAHMQETGFGNLVICRGNQQMLYPSLCVFTFQIPPCAAVASSATYQKTVTRPICPGLKSEIHYIQKEQSHWTIAPLLWQKRGNNRSTGRLFLSTLEVIDSATISAAPDMTLQCTSW